MTEKRMIRHRSRKPCLSCGVLTFNRSRLYLFCIVCERTAQADAERMQAALEAKRKCTRAK